MTLVCVRIDNSFSTRRLTALADTRASFRRTDGSWKTLSDTTTKLFALPVRCFEADNLVSVIGAWKDPYFESQVGLGFSGSCFEALTIIAHISHSLSALVAPNGDELTPTKEGLVHLIEKITGAYFAAHSGDGNPSVSMLVFGFEDGKPWIGKIVGSAGSNAQSHVSFADDDSLESTGQGAVFEQRASEWRRRIKKHKNQLRRQGQSKDDSDAAFEHELSQARHDIAEKKSTEEEMLLRIESEFAKGIGGVLQRLELGLDGDKVVAGFTQDDRSYLSDVSFSVTLHGHLGPIPIVEKMGRQIRKRGLSGAETMTK